MKPLVPTRDHNASPQTMTPALRLGSTQSLSLNYASRKPLAVKEALTLSGSTCIVDYITHNTILRLWAIAITHICEEHLAIVTTHCWCTSPSPLLCWHHPALQPHRIPASHHHCGEQMHLQVPVAIPPSQHITAVPGLQRISLHQQVCIVSFPVNV